jgi:hypothetical protein
VLVAVTFLYETETVWLAPIPGGTVQRIVVVLMYAMGHTLLPMVTVVFAVVNY